MQSLSITAAQVLSCQLQCGDGKMRTNSSSDLSNGCSYINVMCTNAVFDGDLYLPSAGKSVPVLELFGKREEGRRAASWISEFSSDTSELTM